MKARTGAAYVIGVLTILVGTAANILHGKDRSTELYSHERTAKAERIVYKVNRWFLDPTYDITEIVPLGDIINTEFSRLIQRSELEGLTLPVPEGSFREQKRRLDPLYLHPEIFNKSDPTYEVLYHSK